MKKAKLLELLKSIPDDAEIVVRGTEDDTLGEYTYDSDFTIEKDTVYGKSMQLNFSNYKKEEDGAFEVWVLK